MPELDDDGRAFTNRLVAIPWHQWYRLNYVSYLLAWGDGPELIQMGLDMLLKQYSPEDEDHD